MQNVFFICFITDPGLNNFILDVTKYCKIFHGQYYVEYSEN